MRVQVVARLAAASALMAFAATISAVTANAQVVADGTITFASEPGDWIGLGTSYAYGTDAGDELLVSTGGRQDNVVITVSALAGDSWTVAMIAPSGQALVPGTYLGAQLPATRPPDVPGLEVSANGRTCSRIDGHFTIQTVTFGQDGYLLALDATFEQFCDGSTAALRGEVHLINPPPPPPLQLDLIIEPEGTASTVTGDAIIHGTVTCSEPTLLTMSGTVTQVVKREIVRGNMFFHQFACTPAQPYVWTAYVSPSGTTPFQKGDAEALIGVSEFSGGGTGIVRRTIVHLSKN